MSGVRVLGLDVGDRRIGIAVSDPLGMTAQRLTVLVRQSLRKDLETIAALATDYQVCAIVIGLPLTLQGAQGPQANKVVAFAEALRGRLAMPVELLDERLTTVQGQRALLAVGVAGKQRKQLVDQVAAQLILQQFLEMQRMRREREAHETST